MSGHVFVVDSTFKRSQIKVTPGKSLREVLEEACKSKRLNPEEYTLKTQNNKTVDLSQPFRLSGLTTGAKLQLTQASKSPGVVSVAIQLPESEGNGRLSDKFPSTTSLWLILRKFEDAVAGGAPASKLNLTQRGTPNTDTGAGRLLYEQPCLHVMGRNYETFSDLQKTLAQLGLNGGSALVRLNFKKSQQPLEEAMLEISNYFGASETTGADASASRSAEAAHAGPSGSESTVPDSAPIEDEPVAGEEPGAEPNEDVKMEDGPIAQPVENDVIASSEDQPPPQQSQQPASTITPDPSNPHASISVYRPPTSNTPAAAREPDDPSVFEPTIDHAKAHQAALNRAGKNTRLLSDKELAEQESVRQQTLSTIQNVTLRVRYPDQSQIETSITAADTAAEIYSRVAQTLAVGPNEPFELRYTAAATGHGRSVHHQTLPKDQKKSLVKDFGFRGKMMLTLVWGPEASMKARQPPSLKAELSSLATELKVELASSRPVPVSGSSSSSGQAQGEKENEASKSGGKKMDAEAKMKRFLGFGKK